MRFSPDQVGMGQNPCTLVNIKIAGKWMFIPLKMVLIGIDPYPSNKKLENFFSSAPLLVLASFALLSSIAGSVGCGAPMLDPLRHLSNLSLDPLGPRASSGLLPQPLMLQSASQRPAK